MLCSPWLDADQVALCSLDVDRDGTVEPADLALADRANLVASSLLYYATAQLYPGICTDAIRPCSTASGWAQAVDYPPNIGGSRVLRDLAPCAGTITSVVCDGAVWPAVELPKRPVVDVLEVTIDGQPFTEFHIVNDRYLVRDDRAPWPNRNNLAAPLTEVGTWGVEYRWGSAPPADLVVAAEVLMCEFLAGWCTGPGCPDCHLPSRLRDITWEGANATVLDSFDIMDSGGFGIAMVDMAVRAHNPERLQRNGRVVVPADVQRREWRVRP